MGTGASQPQQPAPEDSTVFEAAFRASPVAMALLAEGDQLLLDVNRAFADLAGYRAADLAGRPLHDVPTAAALLRHAVTTPVEHRARPVTLATVPFDAPPRSHSRAAEAVSHLILEAMPGGLLHLSSGAEVLAANSEAQRLLRLTPGEMSGRRLADCVPGALREDGQPWRPDDLPPLRCLATGLAQSANMIGLPRADGQILWCLCSAVPLRIPGTAETTGALAVFLDITQRHHLEEERRLAESRHSDAQRLESLCLLAGGIAHDFNNLLVGILGNAGLAQLDLEAGHPALEAVRDIEAAARRAADLTRQLLAFSGGAVMATTPLSINPLIEEAAHLLADSTGAPVKFLCDLAPDLPPVDLDAAQMRQALIGLLANAGEAIGDSPGTVVLHTALVEPGAEMMGRLRLGETLSPGPHVLITVTDDGCGMDAEGLRHAFDPFYTTKFTGRGLGLAAVLGIIRAHRGAIGATSEPGRGTTIEILLPPSSRAAAPASSPLFGLPPAFDHVPRRGVILVVDDEEAVRQFTARLLERHGIEVLLARDGAEGVALFEARQADIDAVLLDVTMPVLEGPEALAAMRRLQPHVRVVMMSGYEAEEAMANLEGPPPAAFLPKPFNAERLLGCLRSVLQIIPR